MTRPCLWAIGRGLFPTRFLLLIRILQLGCVDILTGMAILFYESRF